MPPSRHATLIGYMPKHIVPRPEWLNAANVVDICSVSECMSPGPKDWISLWRQNEMWVFDTEEIARSIVEDRSEDSPFEVLAFRLLPLFCNNGNTETLAIPPLNVQELPADFLFLGFDIVSRSLGTSFECSPLSCNSVAETKPVNCHCLVDEEDTAVRLARAFSDQSIACEPGPYYIVEVWRRQQ
jgi:hypothetical protein